MSAAVLVLVLGMPRDMGTSSGAPPDSRTLHAAELTHLRQRPACRLLVRIGQAHRGQSAMAAKPRKPSPNEIAMDLSDGRSGNIRRLIGQLAMLEQAGRQLRDLRAAGGQKGGPANGNTTRDADAGATGRNCGTRTTTDEDGQSSSGCCR